MTRIQKLEHNHCPFHCIGLDWILFYCTPIGLDFILFLGLNMHDIMDVAIVFGFTHIYNINKFTCEILNSQIWTSHISSRGSQSSLTIWRVSFVLNLSAIFGARLMLSGAHLARDRQFLQEAIPTSKKTCLLAQVLLTFYKDQIRPRVSFSFVSYEYLIMSISSWSI